MKKLRLLLITLCVSVLMGSMAVTAYAGGGEEWDGLDPVEPLPAETVDPGEGFTEDGNLVTRDLLYDKATNKQFITVQTSGGNTFYIVIDYDKPTDEDGEQYLSVKCTTFNIAAFPTPIFSLVDILASF